MPVVAPRNGPCAPWVQGSDIAALPWVAAAAAKAEAGGMSSGQVQAIEDSCALAASEILYELSGRIFAGACGPVKIRPVARPVDGDSRAWAGTMGWFNSWGSSGASSYGTANPGIALHYGTSSIPEIDLGVYPVTEVTQVKIDGVVIPANEYEIQNYKTLVRLRTSASAVPTERWGWPTSQVLSLPDTEQGTFSVTYMFGVAPPSMGAIAAAKLGEYLALPQLGDTTKYPQRVTSMQRQGVSTMTVDVIDIVKTGRTGIWEVDLFLRSVNPTQQKRQSAVWSPDLGRPRRTP